MEALDDKKGMAAAYERICEDLTSQERLDEAMGYAQKAIKICEANHLDDEMVYALTMGGYVTIAGSKNKEAFDYFDRALKLARKQNFNEISLV